MCIKATICTHWFYSDEVLLPERTTRPRQKNGGDFVLLNITQAFSINPVTGHGNWFDVYNCTR